MPLRDISWRPVYESGFNDAESLMDSFYRPFLSEVSRYDRLAGYLSLHSLANALEGIDSMLENDGEIRVIAGADLQSREKDTLLADRDEPVSPWVESQLAIVGELLDRGDLTIKVGDPTSGEGIFHPKLGIGFDDSADPDALSFEGSVNETVSAWQHNYERFKLHRSWTDGEQKYVEEDIETFETLWNDNHPSVDVIELPEAEAQDIIEWTETDRNLEQHVERVQQHSPAGVASEAAAAQAAALAGRGPGGLHVAEDVSTLDTVWPHQRAISDTAASIYPNNLLFCDEVGLGKTIEVGLTLSRLIQTGEVETALLLVPAGLVEQWQDELYSRFNIHAHRFERVHGSNYLVSPFGPDDGHGEYLDGSRSADVWEHTPFGGYVNDTDSPTVIIHSWHTARRTSNQQHVAPPTDADIWDLTVVDEAHSAREGTNLYNLLTDVESVSECLYALTATPMQLDIGELYDLLRLVDLPDSWDDKERFRNFFETRSALEETLRYGNAESPQDVYEGVRAHLGFRDTDTGYSRAENRVDSFFKLIHDHISEYPGYSERTTALLDRQSLSLHQRKPLEKFLGERSLSPINPDSPGRLAHDAGVDTWPELVEAGEWATPVQSRIFRNTRSTLLKCKESDDIDVLGDDETIPERSVETKRIELGEAKDLYERVEEYISNTYEASQKALTGQEKNALGFVMTTYRQRLTSSLQAITESLKNRSDKLQGDVANKTEEIASLQADDGVTEATINSVVGEDGIDAYSASGVIEQELAELRDFTDQLQSHTGDPKGDQLLQDIKRLRDDARDNVVIFTQYTDTMEYVAERLATTYPNVGTYSGDGARRYDPDAIDSEAMPHSHEDWPRTSKETIKQDFTTEGGTNILVCTDSASEGLNLQTADALINSDLPWNPMRVEQRIGRIDRIGQKNETVKIINYAYKDSVDGDIYEKLEERLDLFEDVVGQMRPVLNSLEGDIAGATMGASDSDAVVDKADTDAKKASEVASTAGLGAGGRGRDGTVTRQSIIDGAGLDGWGNDHHPALTTIGNMDRHFTPSVSPTVIETLLTQSRHLADAGWGFTALRNHNLADEYPGTAYGAYVVTAPDDVGRIQTPEATEETAQVALREASASNEAVVTFDPDLAAEFSSIRLVLPGDTLFERLVTTIVERSESDMSYVFAHNGGNVSVTQQRASLPKDVDAVLPAVGTESNTGLPDGSSLLTVKEAKQQVREWVQRV